MSGSSFGKIFRITTWGESHGPGIGVVIDGCPAGLALSEEQIQVFLDRRRPGQSRYTTKRNETDSVEILSGVFEGQTTGTPISLLVRNQDQRSTLPSRTCRLPVYGKIRNPGLPWRRAFLRTRDNREGGCRRSGISSSERTGYLRPCIYKSNRSLLNR